MSKRIVRSAEEIEALLAAIRGDDRMAGKPALVMINAPLALIQVEGQAKIDVLEWLLGERDWCGGSFVFRMSPEGKR